jgi:hypothetical protein
LGDGALGDADLFGREPEVESRKLRVRPAASNALRAFRGGKRGKEYNL